MANKPKRMDQIRRIIKNYIATRSLKRTARLTQTSRNTVKLYLKRCKNSGKSLPELVKLSDEQLGKIVYAEQTQQQSSRATHFAQQVENWLKELPRTGVTRQLLWTEYLSSYPAGYSYSQFCDKLSGHLASRNLTLAMNHKPGEVVMVDFAGAKFAWTDPVTGQKHYAEVLICVLPFSHYTFAIALPSQKVPNFIQGLNAMFRFFGGVPKVMLSDNLKSYVTRADRYEPKFNELCEQLSAHYQIDLAATRVRKPKDKASVENMVSTTYQRLYAPLRNQIFHSIEEINQAFADQLKAHNCTPYQKRPGCRQEIFDSYEKPLLAPLPADEFKIKRITRAKVQNNYHVLLGQDNKYYSVHNKHFGKKVDVLYTDTEVEIYDRGHRIALHKRLEKHSTERYSTHEQHMPDHHRAWRKSQGYKASDYLARATSIGKNTYWAIQRVLVTKIHQEQTFASCRGILRLGAHYGNQRLEAACKRCKKTGYVNYRMLQNILSKNLDMQEHNHDKKEVKIPEHKNLRGAHTYK